MNRSPAFGVLGALPGVFGFPAVIHQSIYDSHTEQICVMHDWYHGYVIVIHMYIHLQLHFLAPSFGKEVKDVYERPGARVGVSSVSSAR